MLPPDRDVTVTREQYHQAALSPYSPRTRGHRRSVAVELGVCRIGSGKYAGGRGIEVRLDGRRIGELTHNMSERYLPLVDHIIANSGRPGCEAVIRQGDRGIEVELRLPDLRERQRQVPPARPAPLGPPPPVRPPVWSAPPPPPAIPMPARSHAGRFRLGWIAGSVVALLLVVGALADDDPQPSIPPAASAAAPSTTTAEAPRTRTEATESGSRAQQSTARPSPTPTATPSTRRTEAAPSTRTTRTPAPRRRADQLAQ